MSKAKKAFRGVLAIVLIAVLAYGGLTIWLNRENLPFMEKPEQKPLITSDWLEATIANISEYSSLSYTYTNVSRFEDIKEFYGWKLPLTTKRFIIQYDGVMKLGIDAGDIKVNVTEDTINISLPYPKVLSHEIKEDSIEVFDQTFNIFNQVKIEDYSGFATEQKKVMESRAKAEGVFENTEKQNELQIGGFIKSLPEIAENYQVVVSTRPAEQTQPDPEIPETPAA